MANNKSLVVRKYLPNPKDDSCGEGPLSKIVAKCYFHIGNGGVTFRVKDLRKTTQEEGELGIPYQSAGPSLEINFTKGAKSSISMGISTEGIRELAFQLLKGAQHSFRCGEPLNGEISSPVEVNCYGGCDWEGGRDDAARRRYMDLEFTAERLQERRLLLQQEERLLAALEELHAAHATAESPTESVEVSQEHFAGFGPREAVGKIAALLGGRKYKEPKRVPYPEFPDAPREEG
jgi:hypothetical protein